MGEWGKETDGYGEGTDGDWTVWERGTTVDTGSTIGKAAEPETDTAKELESLTKTNIDDWLKNWEMGNEIRVTGSRYQQSAIRDSDGKDLGTVYETETVGTKWNVWDTEKSGTSPKGGYAWWLKSQWIGGSGFGQWAKEHMGAKESDLKINGLDPSGTIQGVWTVAGLHVYEVGKWEAYANSQAPEGQSGWGTRDGDVKNWNTVGIDLDLVFESEGYGSKGTEPNGGAGRRDVCVWSLADRFGKEAEEWTVEKELQPADGKPGNWLNMGGTTGSDPNAANVGEIPEYEHTIWLLDQFRNGLGQTVDIGNLGSGTNESLTGLKWQMEPIKSDGSGTVYVSRLNEPQPVSPSSGNEHSIKTDDTRGSAAIFRSGKRKYKRESWKMVCADGGSNLETAAVPGYSVGGEYPGGSADGQIRAEDKRQTTQKYWSDWYGSTWGGWLTGMFGGGNGTEESGLVKVEIAGREGKKIEVKDISFKVQGDEEIKTETSKMIDVAGSRQDPLLVEPAQIWRRRLTWGLGWWRTELVPEVGTERMKGKDIGQLGGSVPKEAGGAYGTGVTVMGLDRKQVTRRVTWGTEGKRSVTIEKGEGTIKKELDGIEDSQVGQTAVKRANGQMVTTIVTDSSGKTVGRWSIYVGQTANGLPIQTVTPMDDGKVSYKVQSEPDTIENGYRAKEGNKSTNEKVTTVLKKQTDSNGTETVTVEQTKTEWVDSGVYRGGWRPFEVKQVPKGGNSEPFEFRLESRLNGKWQKQSGGNSLTVETGGKWVPDPNGPDPKATADNGSELNQINI